MPALVELVMETFDDETEFSSMQLLLAVVVLLVTIIMLGFFWQ